MPLLVFGLLGVLLGVEGALFLDPAIVNEIETREKQNVDVDKADEPDIREDLQSCDCTRLRSEHGNAQWQRLKSTKDDNGIPNVLLPCLCSRICSRLQALSLAFQCGCRGVLKHQA